MNNRQWLLAQRPSGALEPTNFEMVSSAMPEPNLAAGEILIKTLLLSFDPAMRGWMNDQASYIEPVGLGEPMRASGVGQVVASQNPQYPEGSLVSGLLGWQEFSVGGRHAIFPTVSLPEGTPESWPLSIFGGTGLTAYFGLLEVGQVKEGDTVLVSGAAGATGSVVAQIAKLKGCRVIGVAGGAEKCTWLLEACGVDHVIDYKADNLHAKLREFAPQGINVFFDNVGGETLQTALNHMADFGCVVMCGAISVYNQSAPTPGPNNLTQIIVKRLRVQGFTTLDFLDQKDQALADLMQWVQASKIVWREDIAEGFENIPATLNRLFDGTNKGKQLLRVATAD